MISLLVFSFKFWTVSLSVSKLILIIKNPKNVCYDDLYPVADFELFLQSLKPSLRMHWTFGTQFTFVFLKVNLSWSMLIGIFHYWWKFKSNWIIVRLLQHLVDFRLFQKSINHSNVFYSSENHATFFIAHNKFQGKVKSLQFTNYNFSWNLKIMLILFPPKKGHTQLTHLRCNLSWLEILLMLLKSHTIRGNMLLLVYILAYTANVVKFTILFLATVD